jgi:hypothetical protein
VTATTGRRNRSEFMSLKNTISCGVSKGFYDGAAF